MTDSKKNDQKQRDEFVDHTMFDLCELLTAMGLKNPRVDIGLSEWQCAVFIDYTAEVDRKTIADKIRQLVRTDLKLYGVEDAENITVTVFDNGK